MARGLTRRSLLKRGAAGLTVIVAGGIVWRAWDNGVFSVGEGPAYEPWADWREDNGDPLLNMVRAGILASNPHNTQPWKFVIREDRIEVHADTARNLGSFDPYLREMHIGLGCAVENMRLAAGAAGLNADVTLPAGNLLEARVDPENGPAAILSLSQSPADECADWLYDHIPFRHTNRGPYRLDRTLSLEARVWLHGAIAGFGDQVERQTFFYEPERPAIGRLIVSSTEKIVADAEMARDSARWFRFSRDLVDEHRDGVTLDAAGLSPLINAAAKIIPAPSPEQSDQQWLATTRDTHVATADMFGLIYVRDLYDRPSALKAGQVWQRMHLTAAREGFAVQPLNQPMEMVDRERQLGQEPETANALAAFCPEGWQPTFCFRAGYPLRPARLSPRRPVEEVVSTSTS